MSLDVGVQLDVEAVRQSYARKDLTHMAFHRNAHYCADTRTRVKTPGALGGNIDCQRIGFPARAVCKLLVSFADESYSVC
jgi:hypothetical protein